MKKLYNKKKQREPSMRNINMSAANVHAALEQFLHSLRMIDADEHVVAWSGFGDEAFLTLEKQGETN